MSKGQVTEGNDPDTFHRVVGEATRALEKAAVPHVVFGSLALATYGKPGVSGDVDVLIRPADEHRAQGVLAEAGFDIDQTDQTWVSKAFRDGVMVDLIVQLRGDLFLDDELLDHARRTDIAGNVVTLISPEDEIVVEAASNAPEIESHWYNALSIVMRTELDWSYLLSRARLAPRRMLSLLIYAESADIEVPREAIWTLLERTYLDQPRGSIASAR
jgi:predicted nucleotidyltransferase